MSQQASSKINSTLLASYVDFSFSSVGSRYESGIASVRIPEMGGAPRDWVLFVWNWKNHEVYRLPGVVHIVPTTSEMI